MERKNQRNSETSDFDIKKIEAFRDQLSYQLGLFVKINTDCEEPSYELEWFQQTL